MQSFGHTVTTNKPTPAGFLQAGFPSCFPANSVTALKGIQRPVQRGVERAPLVPPRFANYRASDWPFLTTTWIYDSVLRGSPCTVRRTAFLIFKGRRQLVKQCGDESPWRSPGYSVWWPDKGTESQ